MTADMIRDSATRLFSRAEPVPAEGGWPGALWDEIDAAGYPLALLSEEEGGFGLTGDEAFIALRIAARHAAPVPLAETMAANWLLAAAGLPLAEGPAAVRLAGLPASPAATDAPLPWGRHLALLVGIAPDPGTGRPILRRIPLAGARWEEGLNIAGEPCDRLLNGAEAGAGAGDEERPLDLDPAVPAALMALMRAQQIAGAVAAALDMSVRYASERVQFGRPIARFQAIQQYLAVMAEESAAAGAAAAMGAGALALARTRPERFCLLAGAAKLRCGEAAGRVAELAHQVHGAIGFSHEYPLHPLTRRLWLWRDADGREADWARLLGEAMLAQPGEGGLWPRITTLQGDFF